MPQCRQEFIRLFLGSSTGSVCLSLRDARGFTPFLRVCENLTDVDHSEELLSLLLRRGANVTDLGDIGLNCLHRCFPHLFPDHLEQQLAAVIFLVSRGADVWATDCIGRSVSHVVYSASQGDSLCGSYRRDLWDVVLAANGYNVFEVRGNTRRVGWYVPGYYVRSDFRQLWAGREHLCPYPDDLAADTGSGEGQEEAVEDGDSDGEALDFSDGGEDPEAGHFDSSAAVSDVENCNAENSNAENLNTEVYDSDSEASGAESHDLDGSTADGSEPEISPFYIVGLEGSEVDGEEWCRRCMARKVGGPQCDACGWTFGCGDPNCRYDRCEARRSARGGGSPDPDGEDCAMPEEPSPAPAAEGWPQAQRVDALLDHLSAQMEVACWLEDVPASLDEIEVQAGVACSSIPSIEMDNPWGDA